MINLLIPMAGHGSRFAAAGYEDPKPLIPFLGKRMIEHVVDAFPLNCHKIFMVLKDHEDKYDVSTFLTTRWPGCDIVIVDGVTEGAACTVLLAKDLINTARPLAIMNSDNIIHWEPEHISPLANEVDGLIMVFEANDPKWSYAETNANGFVSRVVEKEVVSTDATAGLYFWAKGHLFVEAAEQMISKNCRVNGEFYVAPVYTENCLLGHRIKVAPVIEMIGVGTPEDLNAYIERQTQCD